MSTESIRQDILQSLQREELLEEAVRGNSIDRVGMEAPTGLTRTINPDRVEVEAVVPVVITGVGFDSIGGFCCGAGKSQAI